MKHRKWLPDDIFEVKKREAEIMTQYSWTYEQQGKVERANPHISVGIEEDFKNHWGERDWRNREFSIAKEGREHANMRKT